MSAPQPSRAPHDVTLDDVEAAVWRLLAGRRVKRQSADVLAVVELVHRYGESFQAKRRGNPVLARAIESRLAVVRDGEGDATKACVKCLVELPLAEFHKATSTRDGRQARCKECTRLYRKERRAELRDIAKGAGVMSRAET